MYQSLILSLADGQILRCVIPSQVPPGELKINAAIATEHCTLEQAAVNINTWQVVQEPAKPISPAAIAVNTTPPRQEHEADSAQKTRILIFNDDPHIGGVARHTHSLLMGLSSDHRLMHVCSDTEPSNTLDSETGAGIEHHWVFYDMSAEFERTLSDEGPGREAIAAFCPDLVIFNDCCPVSHLAAKVVVHELGIPYICVEHFVAEYLAERFSDRLPIIGEIYDKAKDVIAVSQTSLERLRTHFRLPSHKGRVILNGVGDEFFAPCNQETRQRLRESIGVPPSQILCFTAAQLTEVKGYQYQIEAYAKIPSLIRRNISFAWAGQGNHRAELQFLLDQNQFFKDQSGFHFLGQVDNVHEWLDAADLFVLPSSDEGMPIALLEAMAKGLPAIANADAGGVNEICSSGLALVSHHGGEI